jgi:hypothetical protein
MTAPWRLILLTLAFVLFAVAAYLTPDLSTKLTRIAFAVVTLGLLLA